MKEIKILGIIIVVLIVILIRVTIVVDNKITDAGERGFSEGQAQGYVVGYEAGHNDGYKVGLIDLKASLGADYFVHNPTYKGVKELLAEYKQNREPILEPRQFAFPWDLNNYAETKGIRTACVWVTTAGRGRAYLLVAFETVDEGFIFYDARFRSHDGKGYELIFKEVEPEVGELYYTYTITKITFIW